MRSSLFSERTRRIADIGILVATLLIANRWTWLCVFEINKPLFSCQYGTPVSELAAYMALAGLVWLLLWRSALASRWIGLWKQNLPLLLFLAWCAASVFWSIAPVSTVYRFLVAALSAIVASYLGMRLTADQWMRRLGLFFAAVIILSYLLVWLLPGAAVMHTLGLEGSWRGAFSHKNYAGSILAAGASILLLNVLTLRTWWERTLHAALLLADLGLIYFTDSATGMVLLVAMLGFVGVAALWQRHRERFRRLHYALLGAAVVTGPVLLAIFRTRVLALLGRNATLTGRLPVWQYVIQRVMEHNPWLGFGFWTFWRFQNLRRETQAAVGWSFEVIDAHSGYLDTLLFLGVIGLCLLIAVVLHALWRALLHLKGGSSYAALLPLVLTTYVAISNLTISFMLQFESFHWFLLVSGIFIATNIPGRGAAGQPRLANA